MNHSASPLLIFDLDGVLVDSEILSAQCLIQLAGDHGIDIDLLHVRRNFIGKRFTAVMASLESEFQVRLGDDFESVYLGRLKRLFETELQLTEGIMDVLGQLTCRKCIATSSSKARAANTLALTGLDKVFGKNIFTGDRVEHGKPAPDLFLLAATSVGAEPQDCTVVEDSVAGLTAGLAAGMRTYRYVGASHLKNLEPVAFPPTGINAIFESWAEFHTLCPELFQ